VGGTLEGELHEETVDLLKSNDLSILSIDHVPDGPRA
jgi:hypothetical protein